MIIFFFGLFNDRLDHESCCHRHSLAVARLNKRYDCHRAHEAGAKGSNRANASACLLREEKDKEISYLYFFYRKIKNSHYI